ncbi:VOC family protein [Streptomonospora wellingtoniae]|uniref:VOC family protein n=1 Tax=Streptomonospora wellingtoniae TaxID=3075544 RepID=A0ABU2KS86_9ACTN|nr:VOC family protein [Streptomonospora sp. DSM 45055]MDT0302149.1 VOC family protein [Streptomonospora sp. DSM 45055]
MTTAVEYPAGAPCWFELSVPDLGRAKEFYAGLFGWEFDDLPYTQARLRGRRVAGISQRWGSDTGPAEPAAWTVLLATRDLDTALRAVAETGGHLSSPRQDIGDLGAVALARDPAGTEFGLWQPGTLRGCEATGPGSPVWSEVASDDIQRTASFLVRVLGCEPERVEGFEFVTLYSGGWPVLGVYGGDGRPRSGHAAWLTYFAVRSADAAADYTRGAGGGVVRAPADSPYGRWCLLADPFGARLAAVEPTEAA